MEIESRAQKLKGLIDTFEHKLGGHTIGFIECYKISKPRLDLLIQLLELEYLRERMVHHEVEDKQSGA